MLLFVRGRDTSTGQTKTLDTVNGARIPIIDAPGAMTIGATSATSITVGHAAIDTTVRGWFNVGSASDATAEGDFAAGTAASGGFFYDSSALTQTIGSGTGNGITLKGNTTSKWISPSTVALLTAEDGVALNAGGSAIDMQGGDAESTGTGWGGFACIFPGLSGATATGNESVYIQGGWVGRDSTAGVHSTQPGGVAIEGGGMRPSVTSGSSHGGWIDLAATNAMNRGGATPALNGGTVRIAAGNGLDGGTDGKIEFYQGNAGSGLGGINGPLVGAISGAGWEISNWLNVGSTTSAVATGDFAAGDGVREMFYDASGASLSFTGASIIDGNSTLGIGTSSTTGVTIGHTGTASPISLLGGVHVGAPGGTAGDNELRLGSAGGGNVVINPGRIILDKFNIEPDDTQDSSLNPHISIRAKTTGVATTDFGAEIRYTLQTAAGGQQEAGNLKLVWTDASAADSAYEFHARDGGVASLVATFQGGDKKSIFGGVVDVATGIEIGSGAGTAANGDIKASDGTRFCNFTASSGTLSLGDGTATFAWTPGGATNLLRIFDGVSRELTYQHTSGVLRSSNSITSPETITAGARFYAEANGQQARFLARSTGAPTFQGDVNAGTIASPSVVGDGSIGLQLLARAYVQITAGPDTFGYQNVGNIRIVTDGTPAVGSYPSRVSILTIASGSTTQTERLRVNNAGGIYVGDVTTLEAATTIGEGDILAGDGTNEFSWDASASTLGLSGSDPILQGTEANSAIWTLQTASALVPSSAGATITASGLIPAGALPLGVVTKVVTTLGNTGGITSYSVGNSLDADKWGISSGITDTVTTDPTDFVDNALIWNNSGSAADVILTANGGTFDNTGAIRVVVTYVSLTAPTS